MAAGRLKRVADQAQHKRREKTRDHIGYAAVCFVWIAFFIGVIAVLVWSFHLLAPPEWRFLCPSDVDEIQTMLSTVVIGGIGGFLIKNRFM
jgi:hypothetical protein